MRKPIIVALILIAVVVLAMIAVRQIRKAKGQIADTSFDTSVAAPAFTDRHPVVCIDEGHKNFHTASGRYKPFADLLGHDGYKIRPYNEKLTAFALSKCEVLVIANATGPNETGDAPAFTEEEAGALHEWVAAGGSLLLVSDHYPFGNSMERLASSFHVDMSKGMTFDEAHQDPAAAEDTRLEFSRQNGLLVQHPIIDGRSPAERTNRVVTFTGQSLFGPGATQLLKLSPQAVDRRAKVQTETRGSDKFTKVEYVDPQPAVGRAQALALVVARGRVVVLGEAAMFTAQIDTRDDSKFGMNVPGVDNRQFVLNTLHWLSRVLN